MSEDQFPATKGVRRVVKAVVVLGTGILLGHLFHSSEAADFAKGQALTQSQYLAAFDAYKAGLMAHDWPWWGDVLLVVALTGAAAAAYEALSFGLAWVVSVVRTRFGLHRPVPPPLSTRQPSFWFLKAVLLFGTLATAGIIGVWYRQTRAYSVPEGTDIYTVVTGRWAWVVTDSGCVNDWHSISFSPDHKQMVIRSVKPYKGFDGRPDSIAIYDIQLSSRSTIRGLIRGEERLRADRQPVVWDLVLRSPDRYAWHRTDWIPGAYTGEVMRCSSR